MNARHLLGPNAPRFVFFNVAPIDHRLPSQEDGASWPIFLADYAPAEFAAGHLVLQRCRTSVQSSQVQIVAQGRVSFHTNLAVPPGATPVFARLTMTPSILGRIWSVLYKRGEVMIDLTMESGERRHFRYIPDMGRSWFMVSPLVDNTQDFAAIFASRGEGVTSVKAITVDPADPWQWDPTYRYTLSRQAAPDGACEARGQ